MKSLWLEVENFDVSPLEAEQKAKGIELSFILHIIIPLCSDKLRIMNLCHQSKNVIRPG